MKSSVVLVLLGLGTFGPCLAKPAPNDLEPDRKLVYKQPVGGDLSLHELIPVATAERFQQTVAEAGGRIELKLHPDAPHGFFHHEPHLGTTNAQLVEFLEELGWIN